MNDMDMPCLGPFLIISIIFSFTLTLIFLLVANIIEVVRLLIKKDTEKAKKKIIRSIWYLIGLIVICSVVFVFLSLLMVS